MEWLIIIVFVLCVGYLWDKYLDNKNEPISEPKIPIKPVDNVATSKKLNVKQVDVATLKPTEEQSKILNLLETTSDTVYITGKAGTGKSFLLEYFVNSTGKRTVVVAPTGVAALNVGGQTIHSFFKMPFDIDIDELKVDYKTREILRNIDAIVIDEVSMVRVDLMEAISKKLQIARQNELPFGGVQMIMFGDLYQLPPVVSDGELQRYFNHNFGGHYFFNAPAIKKCGLKIYELDFIHRQKDPEFKSILNTVRKGVYKEMDLKKLNERSKVVKPAEGYITLAGSNQTVSLINHKKLADLQGEQREYHAEVWGDLKESSFPTEKILKLKVGAQIMMLKNDNEKPRRWVNGTLGIVTKVSRDVVRVSINGVEHTVAPANWDKFQYDYDHETRQLKKKVVSSFKQLPIRLAWAITIHKSQGQTYQSVAIDLSDGAFAHGQTYVALSRCVSLEGLYLDSPIRRDDIIVDPDVVAFMRKAEGSQS